jgi:hypothetical protein
LLTIKGQIDLSEACKTAKSGLQGLKKVIISWTQDL